MAWYPPSMLRSDFHFHLPPELIAQNPPPQRGASRLLCLNGEGGELQDRMFADLPKLLHPGDLLVFNDTRVIPARLLGIKSTGGKVEVLVERLLGRNRILAQVRASKALKPDGRLLIDGEVPVTVLSRRDDLYELRFDTSMTVLEVLDSHGHIPLPPYIERPDEPQDRERYQTVYARCPGAVAAPTAGLHFHRPLLDALGEMGVGQAFVTLHVGAGTFQPMRSERIETHRMHAELINVGARVCGQINATRARGDRVVAVGTTVVRSLETACREGQVQPFHGETRMFIFPGYHFRCVDALITNFHLPESTLLMLVTAFAGYEPVMAAYRHAVAERYRFFSYGDAMFITPKRAPDP